MPSRTGQSMCWEVGVDALVRNCPHQQVGAERVMLLQQLSVRAGVPREHHGTQEILPNTRFSWRNSTDGLLLVAFLYFFPFPQTDTLPVRAFPCTASPPDLPPPLKPEGDEACRSRGF